MSSYPTGGIGQYRGNNQQDEPFHEPPQFDPYKTHAPPDCYGQNAFQVPYQDEPSYPGPQAQSMKPLGRTTKEDDSPSPDEFNPTSQEDACVHRLPAHFVNSDMSQFSNRSPRNLRAWRYEQGRPLWARVSASLLRKHH